ncbi:MAG: NAD(+)/NADH kinase [Armatimonadetes bacterium]|nr:NAD(+)/NADH kinase [Armatimonadota bacterium]
MGNEVGIFANCTREPAVRCAAALSDLLIGRGIDVRLEPELAARLGRPANARLPEEVGVSRFVIALGGDGTLLYACRMAAPHGTPVLGVHVGGPASFGFLTETTPARAAAAAEQVLTGHYRLDERMMVAGSVIRRGTEVARHAAINDLVIGKRALARMLKLRISVGESYIATYAADGIIAATPTGSTAYNLAAGGPLVNPQLKLILLTPICPHTLNVRSLIVGDDEVINVLVESERRDEPLLTVDGQVGYELEPGDLVRFHRADISTKLILLDGPSFYEKLQTRLRLGERFGG